MSNTLFPGDLDSFTNPQTTDTLASVSHVLQHGKANDALLAIETKLGVGSSNQTPVSNGFLIGNGAGESEWVTTLTSPSITTSLFDANGLTWVSQTATASAVNNLNIANAATGNAVVLSTVGTDSSIDANVVTKGSGKFRDNGSSLLDFRAAFNNFFASGCIWTAGSGLVASMSAGFVWVAGIEYAIASVSSHTFAASVDTYVDYLPGTGITYTAVSNNDTSPALASGAIRLAIVVSGSSSLSLVNQGSIAATGPTVSSNVLTVCDSLGNLIYPTDPSSKLLGYRYITSNATQTSTSATQITGLSVPIIVPTGRNVKVSFYCVQLYVAATTNNAQVTLWDGIVGSGTQIQYVQSYTNDGQSSAYGDVTVRPGSANKTYNAGLNCVTSGTATIVAASSSPSYLRVELD